MVDIGFPPFDTTSDIERIRREFLYEVEGGPERLAQTVLRALREYVTDGEWRDLKSTLPSELADVLP
ncbi:MAG: hypothetical protein QOI75_6908 [Pseudonocardiales bacterium]|nr:hypothetical protein [Pseudonocardiales bacterium]